MMGRILRFQTLFALTVLVISNFAERVSGGIIVYVTSEHLNTVDRYIDDHRDVMFSGLTLPADIALDRLGNLYVADAGAGVVKKATSSGVVTTIASGLATPVGIAADSFGNVYVADHTVTGSLVKISSTGTVSTVATGLNFPWGLTIGPDGNIYAASRGSGNVLKVTPAGAVSVYGHVPTPLTDLAFAPNGDLFAATNGYGQNGPRGIYRVVPGGTATFYSGAGFSDGQRPVGLAFDQAGNLYTTSFYQNYVFKINLGASPDVIANTAGSPTFLLTSDSLPPAPPPTTVPEPGTLTLAGLGALGLFVVRRRRMYATAKLS